MAKDWNLARSELKAALISQKQMLEGFKRMGYTQEDREVKSCERNIRDIERDLKTNYSLAV